MTTGAFTTIAIDGGAASGKSSTARGVSERLNFMHVDTGSHYRTLTLLLLRAGAAADDPQAIRAALSESPLGTQIVGRSAFLTLNGSLPAAESLRTKEVNANVSLYAAEPVVREALKDYQRAQATVAQENGFSGMVMEGRDIGSVIFPDATLKIFLEADAATRALRRAGEGQADAVVERDRLDSSRKTAPLTCPEGAVRVDNSHMSLEKVIDHVVKLAKEKRV